MAQDLMRGIEERKISTAITQEAMGSQPLKLVKWIKAVETMTAALPIVSAKTWRKMPCMFSLS